MATAGMVAERVDRPAAPRVEDAEDVLSAVLRAYADRGVLKELNLAGHEAGFRLPGAGQVKLSYDADKRVIALQGLLPDIAADDTLMRDVTALVSGCGRADALPHRRMDPEQGKLALRRVRKGGVLALSLGTADGEWGIRRMMNLAHEVRVLVYERHPYYAQAQWGASEE
ncbi:hypothetical protein [Muricoccus radiodurans]|uniref:hypothetical protein n=1 Tax=Muricoccus radiodurans TaxID=2231721 RepID=UPI003CF5E6A5